MFFKQCDILPNVKVDDREVREDKAIIFSCTKVPRVSFDLAKSDGLVGPEL